jgi:hypothetical protein
MLDNGHYSKVQIYIEDMEISPLYRCYPQEYEPIQTSRANQWCSGKILFGGMLKI